MARYIDADKLAKDIFRAWELWEKKGKDCYIFAEVITPMLIGQPTADVRENVKGEWILHQDSKTWECSVCGEYQVVWSNFCMHCGADMRL